MDISIKPVKLHGSINVPSSKSISHRALICAALSGGESRITRLLDCEDTRATCDALKALGAKINDNGNDVLVKGIGAFADNGTADIDCRESGSTLRFMIPVAAALGAKACFSGTANLPNRPITPYLSELPKHGTVFSSEKMPYLISGKLKGGDYYVTGDISSQFITGLLLALPLTGEESRIILTSPLQSRPYALLTIDVMKKFGVSVIDEGESFHIPGGQRYVPSDFTVEADMSQAAFFLVANALGANIDISGLRPDSKQGDRAIVDITKEFVSSGGKAFDIDATDIPDLVPILTVLACFADGVSHITGCARLRIKESDRLAAISNELNCLGANVTADKDSLTVKGVSSLHGGDCETYNDHRIAMSLAVASMRCTDPITIRRAQCVSKSYPGFFDDFKKLGGDINVI